MVENAFDDSSLRYKNHLLNSYNLPHLFSIVTWGCCGSTWLAKILNSHPDIFCLHAFNQHYSLSLDTDPDEGCGYLDSIAITAHGYPLAGDVHGVNRYELSSLKEKYGDCFNSVILVRNPLDRFFSMLSCMNLLKGGMSDYSYIDDMAEKNGIDVSELDFPGRLFIHSVNMLNAIVDEKKVCDNIFRMEDVTTSPEVLTDLVRTISGGRLVPELLWAEIAIRNRPVNSHREKDVTGTMISEKHKGYIRRIILPEAVTIYKEIGYDMRRFYDILS